MTCGTWFSVVDVEVEHNCDEVGEEGSLPVHHEHAPHAQEGAQ